jgi:hypothetical protein
MGCSDWIVHRIEGLLVGHALVSSRGRHLRRLGQLLLCYVKYNRYRNVSDPQGQDRRLHADASSVVACAVYYYVWVHLIPKARGYRMRQTLLEFEDGAVSHSLVKVKVQDLDEWDATHDATGKLTEGGAVESLDEEDEAKV